MAKACLWIDFGNQKSEGVEFYLWLSVIGSTILLQGAGPAVQHAAVMFNQEV
jgi:hypothetical protein